MSGLIDSVVALQVQALMDVVQSSRYDLLFDQHQLVVVAACVYAVTRVLNTSVPFKRVLDAALTAFPLLPPATFQEAVVQTPAETKGEICIVPATVVPQRTPMQSDMRR